MVFNKRETNGYRTKFWGKKIQLAAVASEVRSCRCHITPSPSQPSHPKLIEP